MFLFKRVVCLQQVWVRVIVRSAGKREFMDYLVAIAATTHIRNRIVAESPFLGASKPYPHLIVVVVAVLVAVVAVLVAVVVVVAESASVRPVTVYRESTTSWVPPQSCALRFDSRS